VPLPSELNFCSFLQYSPRGVSPVSRYSQEFVRAIKYDRTIATVEGYASAIDYAARKISQAATAHDVLEKCLSQDAILVPVPRKAPMQPGWLWPARRLCQSMQSHELGREVLPLLVRTKPVKKSATAAKGERPSPEEHFESLDVAGNRPLISDARQIVLVDDVITRGSTTLAAFARLREAFPNCRISCLAPIRTMSDEEVETIP
jgi:predicted amidophosphoribosyltransferase